MRNSSPVTAGQTIANKYQVEDVLGEGGMGLVVSAWHLGLEQRVAIKLLLRQRLQHDESAIARFQREARAAARVRSEHVCRVLDTGTLDDGTPFLVMEYLEGRDLAAELLQRGRLPAAEAVALVLQACEGLIEAHAAGIVHRDLKPANLFVTPRPNGSRLLKVLDFGVSKSLASSGMANLTLTKSATLIGSPIYMSPEQLSSSKDVDGRTDIWALGVILYELITGRTPFYGETIPQLVHSVLSTEPASFDTLCVPAPAGLEPVILRALAKNREDRYASAAELKQALTRFAPRAEVAVSRTVRVNTDPPRAEDDTALPSAPLSGSGVQRETQAVVSNAGVEPPPWSRARWAGVLLLLIVGAGLAAYFSRRPAAAPEPPEPPITQTQAHDDAGAARTVPEPLREAAPEAPSVPLEPLPTEAPLAPQIPMHESAEFSGKKNRKSPLPNPAPESDDVRALPKPLPDGAEQNIGPPSRPMPARTEPRGSRAGRESGSAPAPATAAGDLPDFGGRR